MKHLELYVHIPFCVKKCAYCDFLSAPADFPVRLSYVKRLVQEMEYYKEAYADYEVDSIFFGGGTPSILEGRHIIELMDALRSNFHIADQAEITMECNPGTLTEKKAAAMREAGINRLSLGLQSANNLELAMLGRIHTYEDFLESFGEARKAGFRNINIDLMSALPGQTVETWEQTLQSVTALHPEHISAYSLIIEKGTAFYDIYHGDEELRERGEKPHLLPSEEEERAMYALTEAFLEKKGYHRYEISNYAKTGYECRHNAGYWMRKNYLGLGLGASSLVENVRFCNTEDFDEYMFQPFTHLDELVMDKRAQMEEFMFLGLRMMRGVSRTEFERQFGVNIESVYGEVLQKLKRQELLDVREGNIFLTQTGIDVSNAVMAEFLFD